MADAHKNFAYSTVTVAPIPASSGLGLTVASDATFPAVPFNATVWPAGAQPTAANAEIVRVTADAANVFVITRAQESSSARTIVVGDQIAATITAKTLTDVETVAAAAYTPGGTDVAVADGGTGASTAAAARTNLGASASGLTRRVRVRLDTPDATGNGYPALSTSNGFSNVRRVVPAFTKDVVGSWEGTVEIPADYASGGAIVCSYVCNATTGVYTNQISTAVVADGVTEDTAYTAETAVDTTVPGTAKLRKDVSTTLTTTPVVGSTLNVKVAHNGTAANDTLAVDMLLWDCHFSYVSV